MAFNFQYTGAKSGVAAAAATAPGLAGDGSATETTFITQVVAGLPQMVALIPDASVNVQLSGRVGSRTVQVTLFMQGAILVPTGGIGIASVPSKQHLH